MDQEIIEKYKFRKPQLNLTKKVYITKEAYRILRKHKRKQKKSMAMIVCDLIKSLEKIK